ncbi:Scavenger mRNA decapping enzyme C-term binding/HIT domain containing protein, putative [Leishmania lindenbergi]|uniref:Scavenger mRNA decapping enzyme C-term binding/HIT domain containing protein n=1 Tax=Leishmania lindenbergi TaxID=651832 RepID=A0AAW3AF57_9TRYP
MSRRLTHPGANFNFSSPGDTAEIRSMTADTPASVEKPVVNNNHAYLHIVERTPGDFTPNNLVYHQLQRYHLVPAQSTTAVEAGENAAVLAAFTALVTTLQQQPAQSPEEASAELLTAEETALAAATTAEKLQRDPLASKPDAQAHTAENLRQMHAYAAASVANTTPPILLTEIKDAHRFTFYPFPILAAVSIPYCSQHFCVLVNLKPIVPNHLMVVPIRCVGTIHGLTEEEVDDWGHVMRCTIQVLEHLRRKCYARDSAASSATAAIPSVGNYSIAVQQGSLAGQTVDHLHVHVIPFDPKGKLAGEPEMDEEGQRRRPPRTPAAMQEETNELRLLFAQYTAAAASLSTATL